MDEELLDLMKSAGFNEVDIGVESACNEVLESLAKDFKRSDILSIANLLKKKKIPATWFIMLGAPAETRETVFETLKTMGRVASKLDMVFVSTGIRVYNGSPLAEEIRKHDMHCTGDNFLHPVKMEPEKISLSDIYTIAKRFSYRYPNFYFYEKEHIIPGRIFSIGNYILKVFHSRQPVWRLLLILKRIEWALGIGLVERVIYELKMITHGKSINPNPGTTLISAPGITMPGGK